MTIGSKSDLAGMRAVGRLVALALREMRAALRPGLTTAQLDAVGARFLRRNGARSAPQLTYGFPGFNCISVNDQVVHGIPGSRMLRPGDLVKIDVTAELDGYIADAAISASIPPVSTTARRLRRCAHSAFQRALAVATPGTRVAELGRAVEQEVHKWGHAVIRDMCGHGVGRALHEKPTVPNYFSPFTLGTLDEGLVIAVEPIISAAASAIIEEPDGWTIRTVTGCLAAHYEHTIVIQAGAPLVLTALDDAASLSS